MPVPLPQRFWRRCAAACRGTASAAYPAIHIRKDEDAGGNVTGPGAMGSRPGLLTTGVLAFPGWSVAEPLMPVGRAALAGEVEQVPQRLNGADVAGFLPLIGGRVEQFR